MKKIFTIIVCFSMLFLVSCNNSKCKYKQITKDSITSFSKTTMINESTNKMSVNTNIPETNLVIVKNHNYSVLKDPFDYRYAHQKEEELFNMINRKDKEGIKNMFSEKLQSKMNLDKQIDILFDYITEPIIDYEESLISSDKDMANGNTIKWGFANVPIAITESHRYYFSFYFIYKDEKNPQNIGVQTLCVWDEKFDEHWNDIFDSQHWPIGNYEEGCFCFLNDGNVIQ